jgi:adenylate cyclase
MSDNLDRVRRAGRQAVHGTVATMRRGLAEAFAELLARDPERAQAAVETGIVSRDWLENPGEVPISTATPIEVVHRYLERSVEQQPSLLARMGLSAIDALAAGTESADGREGIPTHLAVAFTDLEGFTRYTGREGDEAASQLLVRHHRAVGPIVRGRGGRIMKRMGDGLLLTFPEADAAVLACVEMVGLDTGPLNLRGGVHVGDVLLTRDDVIGHVVNVAARVTESAKGGEVLVTDDVCEFVDQLPGITYGRRRRKSFKGIAEPVFVRPVSAVR